MGRVSAGQLTLGIAEGLRLNHCGAYEHVEHVERMEPPYVIGVAHALAWAAPHALLRMRSPGQHSTASARNTCLGIDRTPRHAP